MLDCVLPEHPQTDAEIHPQGVSRPQEPGFCCRKLGKRFSNIAKKEIICVVYVHMTVLPMRETRKTRAYFITCIYTHTWIWIQPEPATPSTTRSRMLPEKVFQKLFNHKFYTYFGWHFAGSCPWLGLQTCFPHPEHLVIPCPVVWLRRLRPEDIVKGTSQWKGIRVTVKLTIQNRQAKVRQEMGVFLSPTKNATSVCLKGSLCCF